MLRGSRRCALATSGELAAEPELRQLRPLPDNVPRGVIQRLPVHFGLAVRIDQIARLALGAVHERLGRAVRVDGQRLEIGGRRVALALSGGTSALAIASDARCAECLRAPRHPRRPARRFASPSSANAPCRFAPTSMRCCRCAWSAGRRGQACCCSNARELVRRAGERLGRGVEAGCPAAAPVCASGAGALGRAGWPGAGWRGRMESHELLEIPGRSLGIEGLELLPTRLVLRPDHGTAFVGFTSNIPDVPRGLAPLVELAPGEVAALTAHPQVVLRGVVALMQRGRLGREAGHDAARDESTTGRVVPRRLRAAGDDRLALDFRVWNFGGLAPLVLGRRRGYHPPGRPRWSARGPRRGGGLRR